MSLDVLEGIFRVFGIRGHIPGHDGLPERPAKSSPGENSSRMMRILAITCALAVVLLLVLWADALLATKSQ